MRPALVTLMPLRAGLARRSHARALPALRSVTATLDRPSARLAPPIMSARYSSQMPSFPIGAESESFQDQFGAQKVVIEVQAGPKTLSVWTGHVNLAIMAGARDVTLVFRGSSSEPTDAEAQVWSEGPEGADHIKQWHADLVEQLLGLIIPYLHGVTFRIVGLESLGEGGFLVGWVEQAVEQWQKQSAAEAAEAGAKQPATAGDAATPAMANPEFVTMEVFEGREPASDANAKQGHHEHGHTCGSGCSH